MPSNKRPTILNRLHLLAAGAVLMLSGCFKHLGETCTADSECSGQSRCFKRDSHATCETLCDPQRALDANQCPKDRGCSLMVGTDAGVCTVVDT
jgi:hypothetical protein